MYDEEYTQALKDSGGDEEYALLPEFHRFEIPDECHWNDVREQNTNVGLAIEKALRGIEQANQNHLYGIFGDANGQAKTNCPIACWWVDLIEHFSQYDLGNQSVEVDLLGQAYE